MYCLISKPVLKYSNDKVIIQLFYYLNIPKKKVFRLFYIFYINFIKKKWLALIEKKKTGESYLNLKSNKVGGVSASPSLKRGAPLGLGLAFGNPQRQALRGEPKVSNTKIYIRWKLRKAISRLK